MARTTVETGLYVAHRFAYGSNIVVTTGAGTSYLRVIKTTGRRPCRGAMAIAATVATEHVIGRLGARQDARPRSMTTDAVGGRTFEYPIHMTSLATYLAMLAGKIESSGQMIKLTHHIDTRSRRAGGRTLRVYRAQLQQG